ncbi:MAG TPA: hypothetical protein VD788_12875 [Candidatus Polarisedimenticolaceae bacterium]|nr:hypothetical protein [Candidatus Polarisedimenticolaceae bacterium]
MSIRRRSFHPTVIALVVLAVGAGRATAQSHEWYAVDYGELVDRRQLSHSSESVGVLLDKLAGRPLPPPDAPGERPDDRYAHSLLEPLLEPYAFVLPDLIDTLAGVPDPPLVELGALWHRGEAQPAWVELLRARRFVVESDGNGRLRLFLPLPAGPPAREAKSAEQAKAAYEGAWSVLRHLFAAERLRLAAGSSELPELRVTAYAYDHQPARTLFLLGAEPYAVTVRDTLASGSRPPLDLAGLERFLDQGLQIEGGRLEGDGTLRVFGSTVEPRPSLLGRPLGLADLAVAYRAVFHGGLAEPYMSLDRGLSPQTALVNYGGRLRDTALGRVSLDCDIRFKTFSLGIDVTTGADLRQELRRAIPGFRTHLERFAADPASAGVQAQQTRLWFYPDAVDLTVSPQIDVLAMRRTRMSAASERLASATSVESREDPDWTRETVADINLRYDEFSRRFPELSDLDQVVRLLSFFTWLKQAELAGLTLPDLDSLLAVELPQRYTPREFPQLLTFDALPEAGRDDEVVVFDRVAVGDALERLGPRGDAELPARLRFERARAALDAGNSQEAELLTELAGYDLDGTDPDVFDLLAYRAERLRMHRTVLATLGPELGRGLAERTRAGERLRIFSVGIGGLDLGMGRALARASGTSIQLTSVRSPGATGSLAPARSVTLGESRDDWRLASATTPSSAPPDHGFSSPAVDRLRLLTERGVDRTLGGFALAVHGTVDPELQSRRVYFDDDRKATGIERVDGPRQWRYRFVGDGQRVRATLDPPPAPAEDAPPPAEVPVGLVQLMLTEDPTHVSPSRRVRLRFSQDDVARQLEADFPRELLQRLVLGRGLDLAPGQPMPLAPLPASLGAVEAVMFGLPPGAGRPPWEVRPTVVPGEDDAVRLARALRSWSDDGPVEQAAPPSVVGTDPLRSPQRWRDAPRLAGGGLLLVPDGAFVGRDERLRAELIRRFRSGPVVPTLPAVPTSSLIILVSDEPIGLCSSRLARLAADPQLAGKLLAGWCLAGELRPDVPSSLLARGGLGAVGIASSAPVDLRHAVATLDTLSSVLGAGELVGRRVETLPGPFVWYY